MSLVINHNLMASNTARNLNTHYGRLATSTQRLSSGLRINGAADDAAGLAVREVMRGDVAALNQGMRNANDAISMIQVIDGALGVIDEKLIRMKELAEQAATGTYDSTQRLIIDSEFQAMASEIQRIAIATDFNGIKLIDGKRNFRIPDGIVLNTSLSNVISDTTNTVETNYSNHISNTGINIDKYYNNIKTTRVETITSEYYMDGGKLYKKTVNDFDINQDVESGCYSTMSYGEGFMQPSPITDDNYESWIEYKDHEVLDFFIDLKPDYNIKPLYYEYYIKDSSIVDFQYNYVAEPEKIFSSLLGKNHCYSYHLDILDNGDIDTIFNVYIDSYYDPNYIRNNFIVQYLTWGESILPTTTSNLTHGTSTSIEEIDLIEVDNNVKIHFGPMNDSAEDYYDIAKRDCSLKGLGLEDTRIETQDKAQKALVTINDAIAKKDQARAYYGAMQNRLENTVSNLTIQAENLQAAESRISDVDVATEMTNFVRNQILTQSAVAMLSQANTLPQMAMQLIGG